MLHPSTVLLNLHMSVSCNQNMYCLPKALFNFRRSFLKIKTRRRPPLPIRVLDFRNKLVSQGSKTNFPEMGLARVDIYERYTIDCNFMSTYLGIPHPSTLLL